MHDMAIHQNGEQPNPTRNPLIHIFWHRLPSSFKHPNSASVISSAQQCKSLSLSITHHPAVVKYTHANERIHSPTSESWATTAVSAGAWSLSLHMQPLCRFQQHEIAENVPHNGVVPPVPPRHPWGWAGGNHLPDKAAGLGRQAEVPVPYDQRSQGPKAVLM